MQHILKKKKSISVFTAICLCASSIGCLDAGAPYSQAAQESNTAASQEETVKTVNLASGDRIPGIHDPEIVSDPTAKWSNGKGSYVYFGNYYANSNMEKEPVKWRVLSAKTTEYGEESMLLFSDAVLDFSTYIEDDDDNSTTWEESVLREKLNDSSPSSQPSQSLQLAFLGNAFSKASQEAILSSKKGKYDEEEGLPLKYFSLSEGRELKWDNSGLLAIRFLH